MTYPQLAAWSVMGLSLILTAVCAGFALLTWRHSKTVMTRHSTTSLRVELDAMHDAIGKHSDLLKRINLRSVMAERRANGAGPESGSESSAGTALSHKDQLRRRAGIVAGKPAPHG